MKELAQKITKVVETEGRIKLEDGTAWGKAGRLAEFKGWVRVYEKSPGHTVYVPVRRV